MFSRVRYAARVLSSPTVSAPLAETPDIIFEDEKPQEIAGASRKIATFLEILLVSSLIGFAMARGLPALFGNRQFNVGVAATVASAIALGLNYLAENVKWKIIRGLRISDRIAPYFGRRIARTSRILRG